MTDKKWITELLVSSFSDNPSVSYIISEDRRKPARIAALMDYSFELWMRFCEIWLSDERHSCALFLFPHRNQTSLCIIYLDLRLIFSAVGLEGLRRVLRRERMVSEKQLKEDMTYLWFTGVSPPNLA